MLVLVAALIFCTIAAWLYFFLTANQADPAMLSRMERIILQPNNQAVQAAQDKPVHTPLSSLIKRLAAFLETKGLGKKLDTRLDQADISLKGSEFLIMSSGLAMLGGWFFWVSHRVGLIPAGAALGWLIPRIWLKRRIRRRSLRLQSQIADTITLLSNSLKAGYSFLQGIDTVSREMPPPIAQEFARAVKEISLGAEVDTALKAMATRADSEDLDLVLTVVQIQRQVGGNLSEILDTIAGTIRERIKIKGEIKTLTAQGRISGTVVSLLPIALGLFLYFINPGYLSLLFLTTPGRYMLGIGLASQVLGIMLIQRIVNIEV